jgi:hypothetical protein
MTAPTDANVFRNWLADQFRADPAGVGRYAANACRPVRVNRRWWRGQRKMDRTAVKVDNADVPEAARTDPRWRLVPDEMKAEFQALERSVDQLVGRYVVEDENGALALGDGVYVVDAADLPEVNRRLAQFQDAWSRAADRWTTEDGYQRLHALLKEQVGEASYDRVKDLVPPRHELRARFALVVRPLAMRLVPDSDDDPETRAAVEDNTVTLLEAAVRRPREQLAAVLEGLAGRLVTPGADDEYVPLKPSRTVRGAQQVVSRNIPAQALIAAREALDRYRRAMAGCCSSRGSRPLTTAGGRRRTCSLPPPRGPHERHQRPQRPNPPPFRRPSRPGRVWQRLRHSGWPRPRSGRA